MRWYAKATVASEGAQRQQHVAVCACEIVGVELAPDTGGPAAGVGIARVSFA